MKLAIITNILTPYRVPLFQAMSERVEDCTVFLMANREQNRQWRIEDVPFKTEVLKGVHLRSRSSEESLHWNYGVAAALQRVGPDMVLSGGFAPAHVAAYLYSRSTSARYVQWGELTLHDGADRSWVRRVLRRTLIGGAAACIASSSAAREAFSYYGAGDRPMLTSLLPFEASGLHGRVTGYRMTEEFQFQRRRYAGPILLAVGQVIERKGLKELFAIYAKVLEKRSDAHLIVVGEGPLRHSLESEAHGRGWTRVHFLGHLPPEHLHRVYALADVFVFPTRYDCFGLVLSEAMASEVPVVASIHAAATHDLVRERETGFRCDPHHPDQAAEQVFAALSLSPNERAVMGRAAFETVRSMDIESSADQMVGFLQSLLARPKYPSKETTAARVASRNTY